MIHTGSSGGDAALRHSNSPRAGFSAFCIAVLDKELPTKEHSATSPLSALLCLGLDSAMAVFTLFKETKREDSPGRWRAPASAPFGLAVYCSAQVMILTGGSSLGLLNERS